ncbi:hypothetical protein ACWCPG_36435, partial [Streptomyces sp. NPDC001919]
REAHHPVLPDDPAQRAARARRGDRGPAHGEDIRRPLGLTRSYPPRAVERALRLQARTPVAFGGAKELLSRVRITATDSGLALGDGPAAEGPALSLLLAVTGRAAVLEDLRGPGTAVLSAGA